VPIIKNDMPEKKNQHYVPQMHLRNFATDNDKLLINIYHKKTSKRIDNVPIKKQASEDYFYGNDGYFEERLGELESGTNKIFKEIQNQNILPKHFSKDHFLLLLYIVFAKTRTRKQLDNTHDSQNLIFQKFFSEHKELKDIAPDYEIKMENPFNLILSAAFNAYHLTCDLEYKLLKNKTNKPFILSDHPVITYNDFNNQKGHKITNGRGLMSKGLQLIFPISPDYVLFFYDSWAYKLGSRKSQVIAIEDEKVVEQLNLLQILNSNEVIFFNSKVSELYFKELLRIASKHNSFDKQSLNEFPLEKQDEETKSSIVMIKNSTPTIKLTINSYKFTDKAKNWKPDTRIVYPRTDWHLQQYEKGINNRH